MPCVVPKAIGANLIVNDPRLLHVATKHWIKCVLLSAQRQHLVLPREVWYIILTIVISPRRSIPMFTNFGLCPVKTVTSWLEEFNRDHKPLDTLQLAGSTTLRHVAWRGWDVNDWDLYATREDIQRFGSWLCTRMGSTEMMHIASCLKDGRNSAGTFEKVLRQASYVYFDFDRRIGLVRILHHGINLNFIVDSPNQRRQTYDIVEAANYYDFIDKTWKDPNQQQLDRLPTMDAWTYRELPGTLCYNAVHQLMAAHSVPIGPRAQISHGIVGQYYRRALKRQQLYKDRVEACGLQWITKRIDSNKEAKDVMRMSTIIYIMMSRHT